MDTLSLLIYISNFFFPGIAFITGIFCWKRADAAYRPLILIMGCALLSELFRFLQALNFVYRFGLPIDFSLIGYNIYVLAISLLYLVLFKNLGVLHRHKGLYIGLILAFIIFWVVDHYFIPGNSIHTATKYFRIFYSFILCLLATQKINKLLVTERKFLLKSSSFLICIAVLLFFLPYTLSEGSTVFIEKHSGNYLQKVFNFRPYSNPIIYLIYTLAILWIPPKKPFIQLS